MTCRKDFSQWFNDVYTQLSDNGVWLRGGEINTISNKEFDTCLYRILFMRLSTYRDTAESFTHKVLYAIARSVDSVFADLGYLPPPDSCAVFDRDSVPWMLGTNTKRHPLEFDCIGFSNSTILELINVPSLLKKSDIPLKKSMRMADERIPLILLGGANAAATPLLYTSDPLVDGIFVGDDTGLIAEILALCRNGKRQKLSKIEILNTLEIIPGFLQPESKKSVKKQCAAEITAEPVSATQPVLFEKESIGQGNVQISYGCPFSCSFCFESWVNKPYREVPADIILSHAGKLKAACGLDSIELTSFNFNIHSDINRIINELCKSFRSVGLKSQRLDVIVRQPELIDYMKKINKSSLTVGIEGVSERLRRYLHKQLNESQIFKGFSNILKNPLREIKVFLIATGLENKEDYREFDAFLEKISSLVQQQENYPRIIFSVTPLVRFPLTPLEFEDGFPILHMKPIINSIAAIIRRRRFEFRESYTLDEYWFSQVLVRACSEIVAEALIKTVDHTGFVYYSGISYSFYEVFTNFCAESGLSEQDLLTGFGYDGKRIKPWKRIDTGVSEDELRTRYEYVNKQLSGAIQVKTVPTSSMYNNLPKKYETADRVISFTKHEETIISLKVVVKEKSRGLDRKIVGAAIAKAIMTIIPEFRDSYLGFKGSFLQQTQSNWVFGDDIVDLIWKKASVPGILIKLDDIAVVKAINTISGEWAELHGIADQKQHRLLITITSDYPFNEKGFINYSHLQYTRCKTADGKYTFLFSKQSLKKKLIEELKIESDNDNKTVVSIVCGEKFNTNEFLVNSFDLLNKNDWVRIRVEVFLKQV